MVSRNGIENYLFSDQQKVRVLTAAFERNVCCRRDILISHARSFVEQLYSFIFRVAVRPGHHTVGESKSYV